MRDTQKQDGGKGDKPKANGGREPAPVFVRQATDDEKKPGASIAVGKATTPMESPADTTAADTKTKPGTSVEVWQATKSTAARTPLTRDEAQARLDRFKRNANELWREYLALYEDGVHLSLGHTSWASFCEAKFGDWGRSRAYQLLAAGRIAVLLESESTNVDYLPEKESQARALLPLRYHPDRLVEAWNLAVTRAQAEEEFLLRAKDVEKAVADVIEAPRRALDKLLAEQVESQNVAVKVRDRIKEMGGPENLTEAEMQAVVDEERAAAKGRDEEQDVSIRMALNLRFAADLIRARPLPEFYADRQTAVGDERAREWLQGMRDDAAFFLEAADPLLARVTSSTEAMPEADTSA